MSGGVSGVRLPGEAPTAANGTPAPDELRELVREVLRDVLPALAGRDASQSFGPGTPPARPTQLGAPPGPHAASPGTPAGRPGTPAVPPTPPTSDPPPSPPAGAAEVPGTAGAGGAATVGGARGVGRGRGAAGASRVPGAAGITGVPGAGGVLAGARAGGVTGSGAHEVASGSGVGLQPVRLATDEDLREFVLQVIRLADNPKRRRDLLAGRLRFTLAAAGFSAAPADLAPHPEHGAASGRGSPAPAGTAQADHRIERGAVTERAVQAAASAGARLVLGPRAVLTPLARDRARALGVPIEKER